MIGTFYGWYMKCQSDTQALAVIPAVHQVGSKRTCSIQIITETDTWTLPFSADVFCKKGKYVRIEKNLFGWQGIHLAIQTPEVTVKGKLRFGPLLPLKYDIMGPFAVVPFMECRHSVYSMQHLVNGTLYINGQKYSFQNSCGYWEGDRGRSFPKEYIWTQCSFAEGSLMLSIADIPIGGIHFTGVIGVVLWKGKEYRIATYLGARAVLIKNRRVKIVQGNLELEAWLLEENGHPLKAPKTGNMVRTIQESVTCRACYRLMKRGRTLFSLETDKASFEYEYPY